MMNSKIDTYLETYGGLNRVSPVVKIKNARVIFTNVITSIYKKRGIDLQWIPEFDLVIDWLTDNKGKGLFLFGNCGRSKSIITNIVIPLILSVEMGKIVSVYSPNEISSKLDEILLKKYISLDELGDEPENKLYGVTRHSALEILDSVEKQGKLILISSNENKQSLEDLYGSKFMERLKIVTTRILFKGDSLR